MKRNSWVWVVLIGLFMVTSCSRDRSSVKEADITEQTDSSQSAIVTQTTPQALVKPEKINVYIENSGSMFGYVNGATSYKKVLHNLLVDLKYYYNEGNINLYFINDAIHESPLKGNIEDFAHQLSPTSMRIGNVNSTDLNAVYRMMIENTDSADISIMLSDCIISISGQNTKQLLQQQEALVKDVFLTASKEKKNLNFEFYKYNSEFEGFYYNMLDQPVAYSGTRPFYLNIIGSPEVVENFNEHLGDKMKGYSDYQDVYLINSTEAQNDNFTFLLSTLNSTLIRPQRSGGKSNLVKAIEKPSSKSHSGFHFAIAMNLADLPAGEDYILEKKNYSVSDDDFELTGIGKIEGDKIIFPESNTVPINPADLRLINGEMSHVFVFETSKPNVKSFDFGLKRNLPDWVEEGTSLNDMNILTDQEEQNKTFGLSYLLSGVTEAFVMQTNDSELFSTHLIISSSHNKTPVFPIILGIIVLLAIVYFIYRKLKA